MIVPGRNKQRKRGNSPAFPKNKTFSYLSARKNPGEGQQSNKDNNLSNDQGRKLSRALSKVINIVILLAIFSSLAYLSVLDTNPVVKLDQNTVPRNENDYYEAVKKEMASSLMYKNKLSFNSEKFSENIKSQFPEIDSIIVEMPVFRHRPTVNISVAEPSAKLVTGNKNYILDQEGRALFTEDRINDKFDTSSLVGINDVSGHPVVIGEPVLTQQQINYIREIINQSKANNAPAQLFNLEFGGSAVDVKFQDVSYIVKFSFYEDPKQSSGAYFALREEINKGDVPKPDKYIDLRIPDRAYLN